MIREMDRPTTAKSKAPPPSVTAHRGIRHLVQYRPKLPQGIDFTNLIRKTWPLVILSAVLVTYVVSVWGADVNHMTDFGFLSVLPPAAYAALAVLIISACILIFHQPEDSLFIFAFIFTLVLLVHGAPNVLYGTLRYSWSWKHVGMVDYIQDYGSINPAIAYLGVYHNWPGFFAFGAFLTEITGAQSALNFAGWAPVFFNLIDIAALLFIYSSLTTDRRVIWFAALIFCLTNWVGQDYFSPQAMNYFFHLIIIGMILKWFTVTSPPTLTVLHRIPIVRRFAVPILRLLSRAIDSDAPVNASTSTERIIYQGIIVAVFGVIVVSHQITPFMTIITVFGLLLARQIKPRLLPFILLFMFVAWLMTGARTYMQIQVSSMLRDLVQFGDHLTSTLHDTTTFSPGQVIVSAMVRGETLAVVLLAVAGAFRRYRNRNIDVPIIICVIAPFSALLASSYGGEILFRVYFFALPFLALFIALLIRPTFRLPQRWLMTVFAAVMSCMLFIGFLFAYYGKDQWNYFTPNEVAASDYLFNNAPPGTLVIEGSRNYPSEYRNYSRFTYLMLSREIPLDAKLVTDTTATLARWMSESKYSAAFVIISRSQILEEHGLGEIPIGTLENIKQTLLDSPLFRVVYRNDDVIIFRLADKYDAAQP